MRTPKEMLDLILDTAKEDENIRSVLLSGSRANPDCPADMYQDFDICYFVRDVGPYWDNMEWIESRFGRPSLVQKPESMELIPPDGDGSFVYLMIFPDGNRIDLTITKDPYVDDGEPAVLLLDKDGNFPEISVKEDFWYVKRPSQKLFSDCCNEFHWCLNNVAKAVAREELPLAMEQLNHYVRDMLMLMLGWYAGAQRDFRVSVGKSGKYLKKLLPGEMYESFKRTYSDADFGHIWAAAFEMLDLFGRAARAVAEELGFAYDGDEERGIREYMELVRADWQERKIKDQEGWIKMTEIGSIVWGVRDVPRAVEFWSAALDYRLKAPASQDWAMLVPKSGPGVQLSLSLASSPKARRHHIDLFTEDQAGEVERLLALGASRKPWDYPPGADYVVLQDPDGNPFCVVQR